MVAVSELTIITYPHPTLRIQAKPLKKVDRRLGEIVQRMFDLMYESRGVGLAATQVNLPLQLFVMNPSGKKDEGIEYAMINPVVSKLRGSEIGEEGCLSLPGVNANVSRAATIHLSAFTLDGREIDQDFTDYEARIIQHEVDHLNGRLFVDRLNERESASIVEKLDFLEGEFRSRQRTGAIADDATLLAEIESWSKEYC